MVLRWKPVRVLRFLPDVFLVCLAVFVIRNFFPKTIKEAVVGSISGPRFVTQELLPVEIQKKLIGTAIPGKGKITESWASRLKTKLTRKTLEPTTTTHYEEKVPPLFKRVIVAFDYNKPDLEILSYSFEDSTYTNQLFESSKGHSVRINQDSGEIVTNQSRNPFGRPYIEGGWLSGEGVYAETGIRIWKPHLFARGNQEGVRVGLGVRHEF